MTTDLLAAARSLLESNTRHASRDGRTFSFTVPSPRVYPFQWFWDSCFHAIAWTYFDLERAKEELRGLFAWQRRDGLIPHMIFWDRSLVRRSPRSWHYRESTVLPGRRPQTSARVQPPVLAQAVERIVERDGDRRFLDEVIGPLTRLYRYLSSKRDPDGDGLISIISSFESGLDFSPVFDPPLELDVDQVERPVPDPRWLARREHFIRVLRNRPGAVIRLTRHHQEDVLVNSIYAQGLESLGRLARLVGEGGVAAWAAQRAEAVTAALLERCWDSESGLFFNLAGPREQRVRVKTVGSLLPLILPTLPRDVADSLVERLRDPKEFWTPYPIPSVARSEAAFRPHRTWLIWRGPLSMNTNWFLVHGLRLHGHADLADDIAERSRSVVAREGFNEFYSPLTGAPVGAEAFGWATLAIDLDGRRVEPGFG
jgi:glycogen debranching enzyme